MTSASVRAITDNIMAAGRNTAAAKASDSSQEFHKMMTQAKDNMQKTGKETPTQVQKKENPEDKKTQVEDNTTSDTVKTDKGVSETDNTAAEEKTVEISQEETTAAPEIKEAVKEAVKSILEEIEETLNVTEEDILMAMQSLGMQITDLLNPDNLAQIMTQVTGSESTIQLVMDGDMYQSLQELTGMVSQKAEELLENTGLDKEALQELLQKLEQVKQEAPGMENSLSGADKQRTSEPEQDILLQNVPAQEKALQEKEIPVILNHDKETPDKPENQMPEDMTEEITQTGEAEKTKQEGEDTSGFQKGQSPYQEFQNVAEDANAAMEKLGESAKDSLMDTARMESILKQIADYVKVNAGKELTEMELQLHPASLGTINLQISSKGGVITAQLTTQNEAVKSAIEAQVVQLRENLEEQGIKIEAVEVSVASHEMERNLDQREQKKQGEENENKTGSIRKVHRTNINLNAYEGDMEEELSGLDDATRIAMEIMASNGNTMDLLA